MNVCPKCESNNIDGLGQCTNCGFNLRENQELNTSLNNIPTPNTQQVNNSIEQITVPSVIEQNVNQQPLVTEQPQNNNQQPLNNQNNKKKSEIIPIIILAIIIVIVVGLGISKFMKKDTNSSNSNDNQQIEENSDSSTNNTGKTANNHDKNSSLLMPIEDVFTINGKGTVVTGRIERGKVSINDEIEIVGLKETKKTVITGIEKYRKQLDTAEAGDNVALSLKDVSREEVERGQVIAKPNTITSISKFDAKIYLLTKEEGGRHTPISSKFRPQFYFRTTDVTGVITLPNSVEKANPGDTLNVSVELVNGIAMEVGTEFSIREGGRTIGNGKVTKIY